MVEEIEITEQQQQNELMTLFKADTISKLIEKLKKGRGKDLPDIDAIKKEWYPEQHKIFDPQYLPNKLVRKQDPLDETGQRTMVENQKVNRLSLALQKKIVNTAVSFAFGNPVELLAETDENSVQEAIYEALKKVSHECKLKSFNRRMFRELLRSTEVAEYWYTLPTGDSNNIYGFDTKFKIHCALFSPFNGDTLYPYFDETGDMIAFSREYKITNGDDKQIPCFETYTASKIYQWVKDGGGWKVVKNINNLLGKIPVMYCSQDAPDWKDVQVSIERLEYLLSRFAETNDYHGAPKIFVQGEIKGFASKGESGAILEGTPGSKAEYLSWQHAPESVKLEIETLLRFIYGITQTPDVSFDSVKGLQAISGTALQMLFLDARLKVEDKKEILDDYLQRRVNVMKRIVGVLMNKVKESDALQVEPEIRPFVINDESTTIQNLVTANGNKPLISQITAIKTLGWVQDADEELKRIEDEEKATAVKEAFNPL